MLRIRTVHKHVERSHGVCVVQFRSKAMSVSTRMPHSTVLSRGSHYPCRRFHLIPSHVYRIYANTKDAVAGAWEWANVTAKSAKKPTEVVFAGEKTPADLKYKRVKTDEYTIRDFDVVRHMQVGFINVSQGIPPLTTPSSTTPLYHALNFFSATPLALLHVLPALNYSFFAIPQ